MDNVQKVENCFFLRSQRLLSYSTIFQKFIGSDSSLPLQEPETNRYPKSDRHIRWFPFFKLTQFKIDPDGDIFGYTEFIRKQILLI
jgi:hypothetical protein